LSNVTRFFKFTLYIMSHEHSVGRKFKYIQTVFNNLTQLY